MDDYHNYDSSKVKESQDLDLIDQFITNFNEEFTDVSDTSAQKIESKKKNESNTDEFLFYKIEDYGKKVARQEEIKKFIAE